MKNQRKSRTVWVLANHAPWLSPDDRRKNVVKFIHYHDPESGDSMHTYSDEESVEGAMEFDSCDAANDFHSHTLRGHYARNELKPTQVTITTTFKFL